MEVETATPPAAPAAQPAAGAPPAEAAIPAYESPNVAAMTQQGPVTVMEIDVDSPPDVQARERAEAMMSGFPIVYAKGGKPIADPGANEPPAAAKAAAAPAAAAAAAAVDPDVHPLRAALDATPAAPIEVPEAVATFFKEKGFGDASEVLAQLPQQAARLSNMETELAKSKQALELLEGLSPEARNVMSMDLEGKDWKAEGPMKRPNVDFKKEFDQHNPEHLVGKYATGEVTKEDWAEYHDTDGDPKTKRYVQAIIDGKVKPSYEKDRDEALNYGTRQQEFYNKRKAALETSREAALKVVDAIPNSAAHRERIKGALTPEGVLALFFEKDGVTLKPTAGRDAWLVMDREAILAPAKERDKVQARNDATVDMLQRTSERPKAGAKGGGSAGGDGLTAEQRAAIIFQRATGFGI